MIPLSDVEILSDVALHIDHDKEIATWLHGSDHDYEFTATQMSDESLFRKGIVPLAVPPDVHFCTSSIFFFFTGQFILHATLSYSQPISSLLSRPEIDENGAELRFFSGKHCCCFAESADEAHSIAGFTQFLWSFFALHWFFSR